MMRTDKIEAIKTAREIVGLRPVYLDTETTGLDIEAEIVDIAIIGPEGVVLINTLVRPTIPIPEQATSIHGITNENVVNAPAFADVVQNLTVSIHNNRPTVIYNRDYDIRLMVQSARANKVDSRYWAPPPNTICAMKLYAQFHGDWNSSRKSYRWQKLSVAAKRLGIEIPGELHRAGGDANLCRLIVEAMAATPLPGEAEQSSQLFIETFNSMADHIHSTAKRKGFYEAGQEPSDERLILLMHSELSEAVEAIRHGNPPDDKIPEFSGYEAELADCIIRIMDAAVARGLRVGEAIVAKMAYNESRPYRHGKKF